MKLYVGNIPYETSDDELRGLFADYEPLADFFYPVDKFTGRRRGFAFVTLDSRDAGLKVIEEMDGQEFNGRNLRVSEARERGE